MAFPSGCNPKRHPRRCQASLGPHPSLVWRLAPGALDCNASGKNSVNRPYGTAILLALCNYYHYHTQGFMTMMTGMRNVPATLEDATTVLGGSTARVLRDVYLPALLPTLLAVLVFLFMRSMVTLSAVIFLITPSLPMAAVTVMRLDEAGLTSQAAAFSTCIMAVVATLALLLHAFTRRR